MPTITYDAEKRFFDDGVKVKNATYESETVRRLPDGRTEIIRRGTFIKQQSSRIRRKGVYVKERVLLASDGRVISADSYRLIRQPNGVQKVARDKSIRDGRVENFRLAQRIEDYQRELREEAAAKEPSPTEQEKERARERMDIRIQQERAARERQALELQREMSLTKSSAIFVPKGAPYKPGTTTEFFTGETFRIEKAPFQESPKPTPVLPPPVSDRLRDVSGTIRPAEPTLKTGFTAFLPETLPEQLQERSLQYTGVTGWTGALKKNLFYQAGLGAAFARGAVTAVTRPDIILKDIWTVAQTPPGDFKTKVWDVGAGVGQQVALNPGQFVAETAGYGVGSAGVFKAGSKFKFTGAGTFKPAGKVKDLSEVKVTSVTGTKAPTIKITDVKGKPLPEPPSITTVGLQKGSRRLPVYSLVETGQEVGRTGQAINLKRFGQQITTGEKVQLQAGRAKVSKIPPSVLKKELDIGETALSAEATISGVKFTPEELSRIDISRRIGRATQTVKGLKPDEFLLKIEGLKKPKASSKIVESQLAEEGGIIFGSQIFERASGKKISIKVLGKDISFGGKVKKFGDVDVLLPGASEAEATKWVAGTTKRLQAIGEDVRVSPTGKGRVIEFVPKKGTAQGEKFLEVKTGSADNLISGEEIAPKGVLGFTFPDIKKGQYGKTLAFGEAKGITLGELGLRKTAASLRITPGGESELASFSNVPGLLGKPRRSVKDIAGQAIATAGEAELLSTSKNPFKVAKSKQTITNLEKLIDTYTPAQQEDILKKIGELTGDDLRAGVVVSPSSAKVPIQEGSPLRVVTNPQITSPQVVTPKFKSPTLGSLPEPGRFSLSPSLSPGFSKTFISPSLRPSPKISPSPVLSPSISPRISVSPSPGLSPVSPGLSPTVSPVTSPSPRLSPKISPSPVLSPVPSPRPSPSPGFSPGVGKAITWKSTQIQPFRTTFRDERKGTGFDVEVRRKGRFERITAKPLSLREAKAKGAAFVETTSAATFRVVKARGAATGRFFGKFDSTRFKKNRNLFIEPAKFRINTPGELGEITFKGIQASKSKKLRSKWGL